MPRKRTLTEQVDEYRTKYEAVKAAHADKAHLLEQAEKTIARLVDERDQAIRGQDRALVEADLARAGLRPIFNGEPLEACHKLMDEYVGSGEQVSVAAKRVQRAVEAFRETKARFI